MLAALLYFSLVLFSCPAHAFLCAGGGKQGQSINPKFSKNDIEGFKFSLLKRFYHHLFHETKRILVSIFLALISYHFYCIVHIKSIHVQVQLITTTYWCQNWQFCSHYIGY